MSEREAIAYRDRAGADVRVAYRRAGRGTPVVLVHGVGMQGSVWAPQIDALARRHEVVALDLPGHGGSSRPPVDARLTDYADAVVALIDGLAIGQAHVVGHSMGALVALQFGLDHPDRTLGLVAMSSVFCRTPEQRAAVEARVHALDGNQPDWGGTIARWFGEPVPAGLRDAARTTRSLLDAVDPVGYGRTYSLFATSDAVHRDRLAGLRAPSLFLTGADDANSTPAMSRAMAALTPRGRAEIVPGERHMMSLARPAAINAILLEFLAQVERRDDSFGLHVGDAERTVQTQARPAGCHGAQP